MELSDDEVCETKVGFHITAVVQLDVFITRARIRLPQIRKIKIIHCGNDHKIFVSVFFPEFFLQPGFIRYVPQVFVNMVPGDFRVLCVIREGIFDIDLGKRLRIVLHHVEGVAQDASNMGEVIETAGGVPGLVDQAQALTDAVTYAKQRIQDLPEAHVPELRDLVSTIGDKLTQVDEELGASRTALSLVDGAVNFVTGGGK